MCHELQFPRCKLLRIARDSQFPGWSTSTIPNLPKECGKKTIEVEIWKSVGHCCRRYFLFWTSVCCKYRATWEVPKCCSCKLNRILKNIQYPYINSAGGKPDSAHLLHGLTCLDRHPLTQLKSCSTFLCGLLRYTTKYCRMKSLMCRFSLMCQFSRTSLADC